MEKMTRNEFVVTRDGKVEHIDLVVHIEVGAEVAIGEELGIVREPVDEISLCGIHHMSAIRHVVFPSILDNHLNLLNAAIKLCEIESRKRGGGDLKLLGSTLRAPDTLAQHSARRIESIHKAMPVVEIRCLATASKASETLCIRMESQYTLTLSIQSLLSLLLHHHGSLSLLMLGFQLSFLSS